jgi:hypothetical protein
VLPSPPPPPRKVHARVHALRQEQIARDGRNTHVELRPEVGETTWHGRNSSLRNDE